MSDRRIEIGKVLLEGTEKYLALSVYHSTYSKSYVLSISVCWDNDHSVSHDLFAGTSVKLDPAPRYSAKVLERVAAAASDFSSPLIKERIDTVLIKNNFTRKGDLIEA